MAPVALGVEVAEVEAVAQAELYLGHGPGDFAGDKGLAAQRAFVVEQDAIGGVQPVRFSVVFDNPKAEELGNAIRTAGVEGGGFTLWCLLHQPVQFRSGGLVEPACFFDAKYAHGLEDPQGPDAIGVGGVFRRVETHLDVAHGREVVNLIRLHFLDDADEVRAVGQVTVVQLQPNIGVMRVLVEVVDAVGIEQRSSAFDAVDLVPFFQQQLRQVCAVLPRNACHQCLFHDCVVVFMKVLIRMMPSSQIDLLVLDQLLIRTSAGN